MGDIVSPGSSSVYLAAHNAQAGRAPVEGTISFLQRVFSISPRYSDPYGSENSSGRGNLTLRDPISIIPGSKGFKCRLLFYQESRHVAPCQAPAKPAANGFLGFPPHRGEEHWRASTARPCCASGELWRWLSPDTGVGGDQTKAEPDLVQSQTLIGRIGAWGKGDEFHPFSPCREVDSGKAQRGAVEDK